MERWVRERCIEETGRGGKGQGGTARGRKYGKGERRGKGREDRGAPPVDKSWLRLWVAPSVQRRKI